MTKTKVTIKSGGKTYISVDIDGHGNNTEEYRIGSVFAQLQSTNFPSFHGTEVEWDAIIANATQTKIENLGSQTPKSPKEEI